MRTRTLLAVFALLAVGLVPDALAQGRRGGGRRANGRGPRGQRTTAGVTGVFGPAKGLIGGTLPAAVIWPVKNRPKWCAASITAR